MTPDQLQGVPLSSVFRNKRNSRWRAVAIAQGVPRKFIREVARSPVRDIRVYLYVSGLRIGRSICESLTREWMAAERSATE